VTASSPELLELEHPGAKFDRVNLKTKPRLRLDVGIEALESELTLLAPIPVVWMSLEFGIGFAKEYYTAFT
jgi:hypothetical protein